MKFVLWGLLGAAALYVVFLIIPSIVSFFLIFMRHQAKDYTRESIKGSQYEPYGDVLLKAIQDLKSIPAEQVEIKSVDGLTLRGLYLDNGAEKTAICVHGYYATPYNNFSVVALQLIKEGFNILLPSQRASNLSDGKLGGLGIMERLDVKSWVRFSERRGAEKILLYGMSMGATTVGLAIDRLKNTRVSGIVWDSGFSSPKNQLIKRAEDHKAPGRLMAPWIRLMGLLIFRADLYEDVADHLKDSEIPMFFMHTKCDNQVPVSDTEGLYEVCTAPKMRLFPEEGGHTLSFLAGKEKSKSMLHTFIQAYFE